MVVVANVPPSDVLVTEPPATQPDALTRLVALVGDDLRACNQTIIDRMESQVPLIPQLAAHLVAAGGKRLRPLLTLSSARMCGYQGARHIVLAACVEFIHTATLLHDDVVDESLLRRGLVLRQAPPPSREQRHLRRQLSRLARACSLWCREAPPARMVRAPRLLLLLLRCGD